MASAMLAISPAALADQSSVQLSFLYDSSQDLSGVKLTKRDDVDRADIGVKFTHTIHSIAWQSAALSLKLECAAVCTHSAANSK